MDKKRELFIDFINGLFNIEFLIFLNNLPKLHEAEEELLKIVHDKLTENGALKEDINSVDKRIKNRLKNKQVTYDEIACVVASIKSKNKWKKNKKCPVTK